ncbi:MAG: hypothetical protein R3F43_04465 [bacterium]
MHGAFQDADGYGFVTGGSETADHVFVTSLRMGTLARMSVKSIDFGGSR